MRLNRLLRSAAFGLLIVLIPLSARANSSTAEDNAAAFVQSLGNRAIAVLTGSGVNQDQRNGRFRHLLIEGFDVPAIGRFVLGRYWRVATGDQRREYLVLFENLLIQSYAGRFGEYSGEKFKVGNTVAVKGSDSVVHSVIERVDGGPVRVDWRVRQPNSSYKIVDVIVEGVSMSITQRSEFASVIRRNGGNVEGLLTVLRAKTAVLANPSAGK